MFTGFGKMFWVFVIANHPCCAVVIKMFKEDDMFCCMIFHFIEEKTKDTDVSTLLWKEQPRWGLTINHKSYRANIFAWFIIYMKALHINLQQIFFALCAIDPHSLLHHQFCLIFVSYLRIAKWNPLLCSQRKSFKLILYFPNGITFSNDIYVK